MEEKKIKQAVMNIPVRDFFKMQNLSDEDAAEKILDYIEDQLEEKITVGEFKVVMQIINEEMETIIE